MMKPWGSGGVGAWAEEAERAEEEAKQRAAAFPGGDEEAFPTLGEAVTSAGKQGKKKKPQPMPLSQLVTGTYVGPGARVRQAAAADPRGGLTDSRGLTAEEMMMLPRGPRERSEEELQQGGLGGGFRGYGGPRGGAFTERGGGGRDQDRGGGFGSGFDRDRGTGGYGRDNMDTGGYGRSGGDLGGYGRDRDRENLSSRADESGDWGASKRFVPSQAGQGYDDDRRGNRLNDRELPSRADEVEDWGSMKKFIPSQGSDWKAPVPRSEARRVGGFEEGAGSRNASRADEVDNWGAGKKFVSGEREVSNPGYKDGGADGDRWSRRMPLVDESRPVERRRLLLLPKSQIVDALVSSEILSKETTPTGEGSQPAGSFLSDSEIQPPKPKPRPNPFGAARPREEILAEKGQDWRKLEAELENREKDVRNSRPSTPDVAAQRWVRPPVKYEPYGQGKEESRPSSSHSSRPQTPDMSAQVGAKPRPKINPFGDAKPREVLLEKKGKDWRRIDFELEHRSVDRFAHFV
ncbi:hypothetical protein O6H91_02G069300 [Diphasiastrum complanatum]|uniref:Uncharacterized protein n=1 Tax=Diphasiastrum complanatum TaxID=34168 RepID=A0ACC2EGN8_DIPCM|nr:hypothetical protein O6H91_02G069300 [Diphasiastrum complanatum]